MVYTNVVFMLKQLTWMFTVLLFRSYTGQLSSVRLPVWQKLSFTCFSICLGIHDDKFRTKFTYASAFEDRHQTSKVLQVQSVTGPPHLRVILRTLHGTVQTLISSCWVAHKITHVVGIWDGGLKEKIWGCILLLCSLLLFKLVMLNNTLPGLISVKLWLAVSEGDINHRTVIGLQLFWWLKWIQHPPVLHYLYGGGESSSDIRTEAGRHGELGNIFFLLHCCGDALLAE